MYEYARKRVSTLFVLCLFQPLFKFVDAIGQIRAQTYDDITLLSSASNSMDRVLYCGQPFILFYCMYVIYVIQLEIIYCTVLLFLTSRTLFFLLCAFTFSFLCKK